MDSHELPLTTLLFCLLQLIKLTAGFSLFTKFWESELYSQDSQDPELRDGTVQYISVPLPVLWDETLLGGSLVSVALWHWARERKDYTQYTLDASIAFIMASPAY